MQIIQQSGSSHQTSEAFCPHTPSSSPLGTLFVHFSLFSGCELLLLQRGYQVSEKPWQMATLHIWANPTMCAQSLKAGWEPANFLSRGSKKKNQASHQSVVRIHQVHISDVLITTAAYAQMLQSHSQETIPDWSPDFQRSLPGVQNLSQPQEPSS